MVTLTTSKLHRSRPAVHHLEVEGDGQHFSPPSSAKSFRGLTMIRQHQRVYAAMGDRMKASARTVDENLYAREVGATQRRDLVNNG